MVPADHSAGDWNAGGETTLYLGEPAGFVVELENGFRIYHAGDTAVFGDMTLIRDLFRPDLAMLPIGGHFTMDPVGAALATELLGVRHVLPIHWGTFPILAGTPAQLRDAIAARGGTAEVIDWRPGDTVSYARGPPRRHLVGRIGAAPCRQVPGHRMLNRMASRTERPAGIRPLRILYPASLTVGRRRTADDPARGALAARSL